MEKEKEHVYDNVKPDCIAMTFSGEIVTNCTEQQARKIQRKSGGCIRNHSESFEELREAYRKTYGTFHNEEETQKEMIDFDEKTKGKL